MRRRKNKYRRLSSLIGAVCWMAAAVEAGDRFVGTSWRKISGPADSPLLMPTAVAVRPDGSVFVADGVNNRVVVLDTAGALNGVITEAAGIPLANPTGIRIDAEGRLWVADTGNHRVLRFSNTLDLEETIEPPRGTAEHETDLTDVEISADGTVLWIVDNNNHRLLRRDTQSKEWRTVGRRGETVGLFQYPFSVAALSGGNIVVTDVINARAQIFNAAGDFVAALGRYGVEAGDLYRPSGVAVDQNGDIWVADSVTGVVQAFRRNGEFIGVLTDFENKPMHFASPMGLAFDPQGRLYVAELLLNEISEVEIQRMAADSQLPQRKPRNENGQSVRSCTICHLDWMPEFADGHNSTLMSNPAGTPQDPMVSRSETCLSCHSGLVADSRKRVWQEHGHRTGIAPPVGMRVPENLPLIDGKLACRTCHSAHRTGSPDGDIGKSVFLRVENSASELCKSCHADKTRGEAFGTHPVTGMPWPVPQALIDAGARPGPNPRELTCQVCHIPHGAKFDSLLVIGANSNQLCVTCHDQLRPGMFRPGGAREHPIAPHVNAEQAAAIHAMGTRLGSEGQLVCLSCHKLHHGKGKRFMLADDLTDGQMCLRCHSERKIMEGTDHDLRKNHPDERNRLGMTPVEGGPCSACHLFHRFARQLNPTEIDPVGQCTSCHQVGQCAQAKLPGAVNHPTLKCTECHNPHEPRFGNFLRGRPEDVCSMCHTDKTRLVAGPHDAHDNDPAWCNDSGLMSDRCMACHRPHGNEKTGLFRVAPVTANGVGVDGACLACHPNAAWKSDTSISAGHPQTGALLAKTSLPLVSADDGSAARLGCRTCHNPHAGKDKAFLLRSVDGPPESLCTSCHTDMQQVVKTMHSAPYLSAKGLSAGECRPCHQVHADQQSVEFRLMFPLALAGIAGKTPGIADDRYCTGCHREGGPGPVPATYSHPVVPMMEPPTGIGNAGLRLFDNEGVPDPKGRITCRTCHTPHGREGMAHGSAPAEREQDGGEEALRSMQLQIRSFEPPNLCTTCHGQDAWRRFLYFHDPERRRGPLSMSTAVRSN